MQKTQEMWVPSLGREGPLEYEMVTQSSILAWKIPWTEEPGVLQFMGLQRVRHDLATKQEMEKGVRAFVKVKVKSLIRV